MNQTTLETASSLELLSILVSTALDQAAILFDSVTSIPSLNFTAVLNLRQSSTNERWTDGNALLMFLRKSAIVLKSGTRRHRNHINSTLRPAFNSSWRIDCTLFAIKIDFRPGRFQGFTRAGSHTGV